MRILNRLMRKIILLLLLMITTVSCITQTSQQATGTLIGMQLGSRIGGVLGFIASDDSRGTFTGSAIGAVAGAMIGNVINSPKDADDVATSTTQADSDDEQNYSLLDKIEMRNIFLHTANGNETITANSESKLSLELINRSNKKINIYPIVECSNSKITISKTEPTEALLPNEGVRYTLTVRAGKRLRSGESDIDIYIAIDETPYYLIHKLKVKTAK